ncbi:MAG TPA: enoyl-CoA hydratase/isomerase family protein [Verrucomicrobiae bacterium]|jgi:enoyl-CoA hydratase/carnithine racemase|nr:enoyl-CoA hydratase/isomerase family protein [Verrucomicrobiae bacterium]
MPSDKNSPSAETPPGLKIERVGDVLTFTLNNPAKGNNVTGAMLDAMLNVLRSQATHPSARVLVIRSTGDVFCIGRERSGRDVASIRQESARILEFKRALRTTNLISIAALQGDAMGFGFGLAIICDFVVVAQNASLGFPEMRSGLPPAAIMSYLGDYTLPRFAFPMVLFGDPIDTQRALQIGLISQVSTKERLTEDVNSLVQRILKLDPTAARKCKEFFNVAAQNSFEQNCRLATEVLTIGSLSVLAREK